MTTTTTGSDPAASQQGTGDLSARVSSIEAEQARQGGMLQQILDRLPGGQGGQGGQGGSGAAGGAAPSSPGGVDLATIQQQVRDEIQQADRRRAAEQAETKWKDDVTRTLEAVKRERAPREPETGVRAAVQRLVIGRQR